MYTHFLICYDIPNTPKRTKFAEMLKDLGLVAYRNLSSMGHLPPQKGMLWISHLESSLEQRINVFVFLAS